MIDPVKAEYWGKQIYYVNLVVILSMIFSHGATVGLKLGLVAGVLAFGATYLTEMCKMLELQKTAFIMFIAQIVCVAGSYVGLIVGI